jgi:hypothetical protein
MTHNLRNRTAMVRDAAEDLLAVLKDCADDLEVEIRARAIGELPRRIERDLAIVRRARAVIAMAEGEPTRRPDNPE